MRKNKTFQNRTLVSALLNGRFFSLSMLFFLLFSIGAFSQQVIGSFPTMDGGFEGQTAGNIVSTTVADGAQRTDWTVSSTNGTRLIVGTGGRSGSKYVSYGNSTSSRKIQTPTAADQAVGITTAYTVQYYYRSAAVAPTNCQVGVSTSGTSATGAGSYVNVTLSATNGTWTKVTQSATSGTNAITPRYGIGVIRFGAASAADMDIDDFVMYAGAADVTAPSSPTAISGGVATVAQNGPNLDISWAAASGGVDGGGYVVVRYGTSPNPDNDPNQNGIYSVGNTITNGTGSLTGTVRYIGTALTFTDNVGLTVGATYYYKVYTVDKAFNYSAELQGSGTAANLTKPAPPTIGTASLITSTGFTANWTAGDANAISYDVKVYTSPGAVQVGTTTNVSSLSLAISGLSATTAYYYTVTAIGNHSTYGDSDPASSSVISTALSTPTAGAVTRISDTKFVANWAAIPSATSYDIKVYQAGIQVGATQNTTSAVTSFITTAPANTTCTYTVTAKGTVPSSTESSPSASFTTLAATGNITFQYAVGDVATLKSDLNGGWCDIYELTTSGGSYQFTGTSTTPITLIRSTNIKGQTGLASKPVISISNTSNGSSAAIFNTATPNLTINFSNLNCNGVNAGAGIQDFLIYGTTAATNLQIVIRNCFIHDFLNLDGAGCVRFDGFDSGFDMQNSTLNNCNGRVISFQSLSNTSTYGNLVLKNNTFSNITTAASNSNAYANSLIFQRTSSGIPAKLTGVNIDHCTFVNFNSVTNGTGTAQDILSLRGGSGTHSITNCIFDNIQYGTISYTSTPTLSIDNNYLAGFGTMPSTTSTRTVTNTLAAITPSYTNAGLLDFTLTNKSSLIAADGYEAGNTYGASLTPLSPPSTISDATGMTNSGFTAGWTEVSNASGYIVNVYDVSGTTLVKTTRVGAVLTASITDLTANTSYTYKVIAIGDATSYSSSAESSSKPVLIITQAPTVAAASAKSSTGFTANWTAPTQGPASFNYIVEYGTVSDLSSGGTTVNNISSSDLSLPISGLQLATTYYYHVGTYNNSGYSSYSSIISVTTDAAVPGAPTAATATAGNTQASVAFTAPASNGGSAIIDYTVTSNPVTITATAASSPIVVTGLTNGTAYTFTVTARNSVGSSSASDASNSVTPDATANNINVSTTTSVGSLILTPVSDVVVGNGALLTINIPTNINSLTIAGGSQVTNTSSLIASAITINSDGTNGTGTYNDYGGSTSVTSAIVKQYLSSSRNWYMSSPVSGASSLPTVDGAGSLTLYSYPENDSRQAIGVNGVYAAGAVWNTVSGVTTMTFGIGYIAKPSAATSTVTFSGTGLNTGNQTISGLTYTSANPKHGFNLIGNPYPSYLNVLPSISANAAGVEPTVWYRTRDNANYYHCETVNTTTGVGTNSSLTGRVTGYIPPMQGFWVRTISNNQSISLLNSNRSHTTSVDLSVQGLGSVPTTLLKSHEKQNQTYSLLGLNVSNGITGDETILMFASGASNGLDAYDSGKMSNSNINIPELFTMVDGSQLAINSMNSIPYDTEISLGFTTGTAGTFSIKASELRNFDAGIQLILKDYLDINNPVTTDLSDGSSYSFTSDTTTSNTSRFTLIFKAPSTTTGINPENNGNVWISIRNGQIVVNGTTNRVMLEVFNAVGQKVISRNLTGTNAQLNNSLATGAYLVKLTTEGKSITRKIIID